MSAIEVTNELHINHGELGAYAWEWDAYQQAEFLTGFAKAIRKEGGMGVFQISYIAAELRKEPGDLDAVRWLNDRLTEYLADQP